MTRPFFTGITIALISGSVLISQLSSGVLLGILYHYDFRFLASSLALLGLGFGAIAVAFAWPHKKSRQDSILENAIPAFAVLHLLPFVALAVIVNLNVNAILGFVIMTALFFIAYTSAGAVIGILLASNPHASGLVYACDLLGAALACPIALVVTDQWGVQASAIILIAISILLILLQWVSFAYRFRKNLLLLIFLIALAFWYGLSFQFHCFDSSLRLRAPTLYGSNSFSFVEGQALPSEDGATLVRARINCTINTYAMITGNLARIVDTLHDFRYIPFELGNTKSTAILGSGAGVDIERALLSGSQDVSAIEINPTIVSLVSRLNPNRFPYPYGNASTSVVYDEARTFMAHASEKYNLILIAQTKNFGQPWGSQLFIPKNIYTREAFATYLSALQTGGTIAVFDLSDFISQYAPGLNEAASGNGHIFIIPGRGDYQGYSWLLYMSSSTPKQSTWVQIIASKYGANAITYGEDKTKNANETALTDDRPFLWQYAKGTEAYYPEFLIPYRDTIRAFLLFSMAMLVILILTLGLFLRAYRFRRAALFSGLFFIGLGAGFAALQFFLLNKLTLLLGNPIYAHAFVLTTIFIAGGLGSIASLRIRPYASIPYIAAALLATLAVLLTVSDWILVPGYSVNPVLRVCLAVLASGIPSFFSAILFASMLKAVSLEGEKYLLWMWGIDGIAFVVASLFVSGAVIIIGVKHVGYFALALYMFATIIYIVGARNVHR